MENQEQREVRLAEESRQAELARQTALQEAEDARDEVVNIGRHGRGNRGQRYAPQYFDEDDLDINEVESTRAIVPPPLLAGAKFDITSSMI